MVLKALNQRKGLAAGIAGLVAGFSSDGDGTDAWRWAFHGKPQPPTHLLRNILSNY